MSNLRRVGAGHAALFWASPPAALLAALSDLSTVSSEAWSPDALGLGLRFSVALLWMPLALILVGALALLLPRESSRLDLTLAGVTATCIALVSYLDLVSYRGFAGYLPFMVAWTLLAVLLAVGYFGALRKGPRWLLFAVSVSTLIGLLGSMWLTSKYLDGRYPTLLVALFQLEFLLLHLLIVQAATLLDLKPRLGGGVGLACLGLSAACVFFTSPTPATRARVMEESALGLTAATNSRSADRCSQPVARLSQAEADEIFVRHAGLPDLPPDFHIDDYNILLVTVEAVRADAVLGTPDQAPNLAELASNAQVFERAYAPSSRTWLSIVGLFTMRLPSESRIKTRIPSWTGDLSAEAVTVAEALSGAGYRTRATRHDFKGNRGLDQGFATIHEELSLVVPREVADHNLASHAIDGLAAAQREAERFFHWIFFVSPHHPYGSVKGSTAERYAHSVRNFDLHLGRVLDYLERAGLHEKTVVIVAADHGEDLHTKSHGTNLNTGSVHVPLVVTLPGVERAVHSAPTSLVYVFPWLLRSSRDPHLAKVAEDAIRQHIAPTMKASGGAVISELLDRNTEMTSLVWAKLKIDHNFRSGRTRAFDAIADRADRQDILAAAEAADYVALLQEYRGLRACHLRATLSDEPGETRDKAKSTRAAEQYDTALERTESE